MLKLVYAKYFYEKRDGFTLVELLITLAVSGIIMTGIYSAFKTQQDSYITQDQVAEMQQNIRAGFYVMANELRMAGYDIDNNGDKANTAGITVASASSVTFTIVADTDGITDDDSDGTIDNAGELKTVTYALYDAYSDGITDLGRMIGTGAWASSTTKRAVSENIEQLEFFYTLADGTTTLAPTATQLSQIRSIQVSMLAITAHPDRNYTNTNQYCPASNPTCAVTGTVWTANDNFRRRFQTMTVNLRNMGL